MRLVIRPIFKLVASRLTRIGETIIVAICGTIVPRLPVSANAKDWLILLVSLASLTVWPNRRQRAVANVGKGHQPDYTDCNKQDLGSALRCPFVYGTRHLPVPP